MRTKSTAFLMCWPVAARLNNSGDALLTFVVKCMSWKLTLPAPPPPPEENAPVCDAPQLNDSISIVSLCLESFDSPLMPSISSR